MNRRKAIKVAAAALLGSGASVFTLTTAFRPEVPPSSKPKKLVPEKEKSGWMFSQLDPATTADMAYRRFDTGSCMYAVFDSVISQLAEKFGEPYASFPSHMMKYGHGGIGGFGTVCGALNGGAALIGLLVANKQTQDTLIAGLFRWYERGELPLFNPSSPILNFTCPSSVSGSTLCHASITKWGQAAGYRIKSKQRKERCRRLTADVAAQVAETLNEFFESTYTTHGHDDETARTCMTCHGEEGKLGNTGGKMSCASCHSESLAHRLFADFHHKTMRKKE
jgi:hypothetical protein